MGCGSTVLPDGGEVKCGYDALPCYLTKNMLITARKRVSGKTCYPRPSGIYVPFSFGFSFSLQARWTGRVVFAAHHLIGSFAINPR